MSVEFTSYCVMCGKPFKTTRRDAQYCSSACKSKMYRQRRKLRKEVQADQLTLDDQKVLTLVDDIDGQAGSLLRKLHQLYGKQAFNLARDAIWRVVEIETKNCAQRVERARNAGYRLPINN